MDEKRIEYNLERLKKEIPVNYELKKSLRNKYIKSKKINWFKRIVFASAAAAAVACLALASYLVTPENVIQRANAASLKIANHVSFVDIGGGSALGVSEYKGKVYIPVAGKGLFYYDKKGFHKVSSQEVNYARVSPDGKKIAVSAEGTISIINPDNGTTQELLKGGKGDIYYEEPSWSPDGKSIIYARKTMTIQEPHGLTEKSEVYSIDLKNRQQKKICEGTHPSYVKGTGFVVFERDQKIIYRNLKDNTEKVMDNGRFPSVSPDGGYVVYVKTEQTSKEVAPQAKVTTNADNVWIADASDFKTKKRVTSNYPNQFIDINRWVKSLKKSTVPQVLALNGRYSYYEPVWGSDSESIYVLKNLNEEGNGGMRLVRVDFTLKKQSPEDTVKRFLQALVVRDDDYAKSIMKNPPAMLTVSNPHNVGYRIIGRGKEGEREYVDAEVDSEYTANPYFGLTVDRFYLSPAENGYIIDEVKELSSINVGDMQGSGEVYLTKGGKKQLLFNDADIPASCSAKGKHRLASMTYNQNTNTLVFAVQILQDKKQEASVKLVSYNLNTKEFKLIDHITMIGKDVNIGIENLIIDAKGERIAADLFSDNDKSYRSYCFVYDLKQIKKIMIDSMFEKSIIEATHTKYWDEGKLVFSVSSLDQLMEYVFEPVSNSLSTL